MSDCPLLLWRLLAYDHAMPEQLWGDAEAYVRAHSQKRACLSSSCTCLDCCGDQQPDRVGGMAGPSSNDVSPMAGYLRGRSYLESAGQ
jgi:hypothetical protein